MNKKINLSLASFLSLAVVGCNWGQPNTVEKETPKTIIENNLKTTKKVIPEVEFIPVEKTKESDLPVFYEAKVSEQEGASIVFSINPQDLNFKTKQSEKKLEGFNTLANTNGTVEKTIADIDHYVIYLVKNASASPYPLNGDPLGTDLVGSGFNLSVSGESSINVRFTNVLSSGTDYYYVAVRAQDGTNADLIKDNNGSGTAWTNTTATTPGVAVSTGAGISVNASLVVSPTTPLVVTPNLKDGTGATIEATITPNSGVIPSTSFNRFYSINTVAGNGSSGFSGDSGQATDAQIRDSFDLKVDNAGNIYIADSQSNRIRKVDGSTGLITTIAGDGTAAATGDGGPATDAQLDFPMGCTVDGSGNLYIADRNNNRIRKVDASTGIITTIAGNGTAATTGDGGQATDAQINGPTNIEVDSSDNLYISMFAGNRIRRIDNTTGIITTVAGNGTGGNTGDGGPATDAQLNTPNGLDIDASGNIYVASRGGGRIRRIDNATGIITTVAGGGGSFGDGGQATDAQLGGPNGVEVDSSGNIYIADTGNHRIRKVDNSTNIISTIAGSTQGFSGDGGDSTSAQLENPVGIDLNNEGIYVADRVNYRIRKIN